MDDLQETLNAILSDPKQMEELTQMASGILGGGESEMPELTGILKQLNGPPSNTQKLLTAMEPFLKPGKREKLSRALRIAKLASVAELALQEKEGEL